MNKLLNFDLAFRAKLLGFDLPVQNRYFKNGKLNGNDKIRYGEPSNYNHECFQDEGRSYTSAPSYAEMFDYILKKHSLSIEIFYYTGKWHYEVWALNKEMTHFTSEVASEEFETYDGALYMAFIQTINSLIDN